jgi:hypothetical protein
MKILAHNNAVYFAYCTNKTTVWVESQNPLDFPIK